MSSIPSREKALKKLGEWEDKSNRVCLSINIERKVVDGKVTVSACINGDYLGPVAAVTSDELAQQPVLSEYTDMDKFVSVVGDIIKAKAKALA